MDQEMHNLLFNWMKCKSKEGNHSPEYFHWSIFVADNLDVRFFIQFGNTNLELLHFRGAEAEAWAIRS